MIHHELRIKKATHHIRNSYPWIDREDVYSIILDIEKAMKKDLKEIFEPMDSQAIIDLVCDICKGI